MAKKGEVVVITGASAGIGRAAVEQFARRGARIGLIARDQNRLQATKREVQQLGGEALPLSVDVADADAVENAAARVENEFGPLDVWINSAMANVVAPVIEIRPEEFKRATEVTYLGFVYGTMAALRRMVPRDKGTIVQVGSGLAFRSIPLQAAYCGAKHAILGFTDSLRSELIHQKSKVHVTVVQLAAMNTPQFSWCRTRVPRRLQPVPPIYQPEVAARAIYWAAHHRRREVFVGASTPAVIYGQNLFPGLADWFLGKAGYKLQQTSQTIDPERPDNLFEPVPGEFAARGILSDKAINFSLQSWASLHRGWAGLATSALAGAGVLLWKRRR
ncbi:MAG: SDR family oxidoreductase [Bryobacteraceae bacterium]